MNTETINTQLYEKMFAEQERYRDWLLHQPPEEILNHTYEYTTREDILMTLEDNDLSFEQAWALLSSPTPLADVFKEFENRETDYMDVVRESMASRANTIIDRHQSPLYLHDAAYAVAHNEMEHYLNGMSATEIARELTAQGIPTKDNKANWKSNRLTYMLSNERYAGHTLHQKFYGEATVPFKRHRNCGEYDQFYAENTHEAILAPDVYEAVQRLLAARRKKTESVKTTNTYPLTSRIRCSECGALYHRKTSNGVIKWVCSRHAADTAACGSHYYSEARIYDGIITMINKLRFCEEDILGQTIQKLEFAAAAYKRNNRAASLLSQSIAELNAKLLALERLRTKGYLATDIYHTQAREIRQQLDKLKTERYSSFESKILTMLEDVRKLKSLIDELEQPLEVFDEKLFHEIVTDICINNHDEMTVTLLGGLRFTEQI